MTVPGVVDAWVQLSERFGRLGLGRCLQPARELAAGGYPAGALAAASWREWSSRLRPGSPFAGRVTAGQRLTNPALAASLDAIAAGGREAHYGGAWASAAVTAVREAGGVLGPEDLTSHRGEWVAPIHGPYRHLEVFEHPPNGQGAAVLVALAQRDKEAAGRPEDPETVVRVVTAIRNGMRLAACHVADPRHADVPDFWSGRDTVYTAAVAGGMAVSLITSVFWLWGSGLAAGGAVIQNRGAGFSLDPAHPNAAGPAKRPFHTIIPALVRDEGRPWAVLGVVGGPMQPQGQVQVLSHLVDHSRDPQSALDAPRARWLGRDLVGLEVGLGRDVADALRGAGFEVLERPLPASELGAGQVVRIHADGWLEGGADQRRDGVAFGY